MSKNAPSTFTVYWQNPFHIIRLVVFALLTSINLLILVLAGWNVSASRAVEQSVPATDILLILESCAIFICVTLGLAELIIPNINTARVIVEFFWATIISTAQTGTIISVTLMTPSICHLQAESDLCATSSLLVPLGWLSSFILLSYFLLLFVLTVTHLRVIPSVIVTSIYKVDWFGFHSAFAGHRTDGKDELDSWTRYMKDIEAARPHLEPGSKAPWARTIRRGIDSPFSGIRSTSRREAHQSSTTHMTATKTPTPALRPLLLPLATVTSISSKSDVGSRFLERFHDSAKLSRSDSESVFGLTKEFDNGEEPCSADSRSSSPFPHKIENHDLPIPLPRLSEWIRADAIKGISVHSIPTSP